MCHKMTHLGFKMVIKMGFRIFYSLKFAETHKIMASSIVTTYPIEYDNMCCYWGMLSQKVSMCLVNSTVLLNVQ